MEKSTFLKGLYIITSIIMIVISIAAVYLFPYTLTLFVLSISIPIFIGLLFFIRNQNAFTNYSNISISNNKCVSLLIISFFILYSLILIIVSLTAYIMPLEYYVLLTIITAICFFEILFFDISKFKILIFLQVISLFLLTVISNQLINQFIFGYDSWYHYLNINQILIENHLSQAAGYYYYYPNFHLIMSVFAFIGSFSQLSYGVIPAVMSFALILLIYILTKILNLSYKSSLITILILSILPSIHSRIITYYPQFLSYVLIILLIYLIVETSKETARISKMNISLITIVSLVSLIFYHPVSTIFFIITLVGFVIFKYLIKIVPAYRNLNLNSSLIMLSCVLFLAYIVFYANMFLDSLIYFTTTSTPALISTQTDVSFIKSLELMFSYIPYSFLAFFATIGLFKIFKLGEKSLPVITSFIIVLVVAAGGMVASPGVGIPRFMTFVEILMAPLSALGILAIFNTVKNKESKFFVSIMIILFIFTSMTSYMNFDGNTIFKDEISVSVQYITNADMETTKFSINSDIINNRTNKTALVDHEIRISYALLLNNQSRKMNMDILPLQQSNVEIDKEKYKFLVLNLHNNKVMIRDLQFKDLKTNVIYSNGFNEITQMEEF
ncbi:DUF6541 family protein [Methanobacterium sp. 42_16]|uniref:DUF6541 family protein n=1 Tax=Methanobacterium sp. 42_16 TaxID=1641383 RepID=UPI002580147A|nr:DUF6541 family protein [Methanobacterium sp. 42_16]